jgi:hypothetical protein
MRPILTTNKPSAIQRITDRSARCRRTSDRARAREWGGITKMPELLRGPRVVDA